MMTESTELAEDVVPKHVHRGAAVDLLRRRGRQTREHQRSHQSSSFGDTMCLFKNFAPNQKRHLDESQTIRFR